MDKTIENIQINEYNNRKIVISTKQGTPFRVQLPRMYMPFGVSGFTPEVGQTKYNIDFAVKGYDEEDSYMKKLYEKLTEGGDRPRPPYEIQVDRTNASCWRGLRSTTAFTRIPSGGQ